MPKSMRTYKYTVQQSDSFATIAQKFYGTQMVYEDLAKSNNLKLNDVILPGKKLNLAGSLAYTGYDPKATNKYPIITVNVILPEVVEHIIGPSTVNVGAKAEYKIDKYKATATDDDKLNSQWKIDVFFEDGTWMETIEPEKAKPAYITNTPNMISIDKVPATWENGSFKVFSYALKPNSAVSVKTIVTLPEVVEHVSGPSTVKIGAKAEYKIDKYKATATDDDKLNTHWKINVFFKDGSKKETIEPEKVKPAYIKNTPSMISVDKIPGTWANGSFQVLSYPYVQKPNSTVSVKTNVTMDPVILSRSAQRPGFYSRTSKKYTDVADDMTYNDYSLIGYGSINKFTLDDTIPMRIVPSPLPPFVTYVQGLCWYSDSELFVEMRNMCNAYFTNPPLRAVVKKIIDKFEDKGTSRLANYNTRADAFEDPDLTAAALAHDHMKDFVQKAKDNTVSALRTASLDPLAITPFTMPFHPTFNYWSDILNGLKITINDTWAYDIDLTDFNLLDAKKFRGKIRIVVYDNFGLDEPDIHLLPTINPPSIRPFVALDGFRAWFILQHLRGYLPFWTVFQTEVEFDGSL